MHIFITIFAVIILATGIYFRNKNVSHAVDAPQAKEVLSENIESPVTRNEEFNEPNETPDDISESIPTPTDFPTPGTLDDFKYPNAVVISSDSASIILESSENANEITNWYKEKINARGMNVRSFVVTSTNSKVLNKLVGANSWQEIAIEISRENNTSVTKISVLLKTS